MRTLQSFCNCGDTRLGGGYLSTVHARPDAYALTRASPTSRINSSGKGTGTSQRPHRTGRRSLASPTDSSRMDQWYGPQLRTDAVCIFSHINVVLRQILTHSHSRVVMKALLHAHKRKRISVYVTEGGVSKFPVVIYLTANGCKLNREDWGKLRPQVNE